MCFSITNIPGKCSRKLSMYWNVVIWDNWGKLSLLEWAFFEEKVRENSTEFEMIVICTFCILRKLHFAQFSHEPQKPPKSFWLCMILVDSVLHSYNAVNRACSHVYQIHQTPPAAFVGFRTVCSQAMDALHLLLYYLVHVDGFWMVSAQNPSGVRVNVLSWEKLYIKFCKWLFFVWLFIYLFQIFVASVGDAMTIIAASTVFSEPFVTHMGKVTNAHKSYCGIRHSDQIAVLGCFQEWEEALWVYITNRGRSICKQIGIRFFTYYGFTYMHMSYMCAHWQSIIIDIESNTLLQ